MGGKGIPRNFDFLDETTHEYDIRRKSHESTSQRKRYRSSSQESLGLRNESKKQRMISRPYEIDNSQRLQQFSKLPCERRGQWRSLSTKSNKYYYMNGGQSRSRQQEFSRPKPSFVNASNECYLQKFVPNPNYMCMGFNKPSSSLIWNNNDQFTNIEKDSVIKQSRDVTNFGEIQDTKQTIKGSGFKFFEKLLDEEPNEVVVRLASPKTRFDEFLSKDMSSDLLYLILRVLAEKVCVAGFHHNKVSVLIAACQKAFLDQLSKHIIDLLTEEIKSRICKIHPFFENLLVFYETILNLIPSTAREKFKNLFIKTELSISGVMTYHKINCDSVKVKFDNLFANLRHMIEQHDRKETSGEEYEKNVEASSDFRNCNIFPTKEDFIHKPVLRPSIIKGAYINVDHYLDVQFRLLREDFVGPLRNGIAQYIEYCDARNRSFKNIDNLKIYHGVMFVKPFAVKDKMGYILNFDPDKKLKRVQWENSKRLMFGSLLCFTTNNFGNFFFGTVLERNKNMLVSGIIAVQLYNEAVENLFDLKLTMAESEVYFEPYRQVLKALRSLPSSEFPMKPYIVDGITDVQLPKYICRNPEILTYKIDKFNIPITDINSLYSWPKSEVLKIDSSQHASFRNALIKEFAIIQGPPGTGKTFLGLKIIETLIANKNLWNYDDRQILVVCYTNHALDQVLKGVLRFTKKIIRVGGQSRSDALEEFNLLKVRKRSLYGKITSARDTFQEMLDVLDRIHSLQKRIDSISENKGIISIRNLQLGGISIHHLDCFINSNFTIDELLFEWLTENADLSMYEENLFFQDNSTNFIRWGDRTAEERREDNDDENFLRKSWIEDRSEINIDTTIKNELCYALNLRKLLSKITSITELMKDCRYGCEKYHCLQAELTYHQSVYRFVNQQLQQHFETGTYVIEELLNVDNLWDLNNTQRWILYKHWCSRFKAYLMNEESQLRQQYENLSVKYDEFRDMEDIKVMKEALIIGMTTSGAARKQSLLKELKPRIVIVEEAAEVLESHVVISMTKACEHLILIGDHKQLRPSTATYELAQKFNLNISLFERMIENGMQYDCLEIQHRMRPEIVKLITPTIYPVLKSYPSVYQYPNVRGVSKNLYFIDHKFYEEKVSETVSHRNVFEAKFLLAFCRYLLLQGYSDEEITILTTYSGQMYYMKKLKKEEEALTNVRITILDNFQGEENKIILLSLVRSNEEGKIGFLNIENRICVALSRAREGFFITGNMENLSSGSKLWARVKEILEEQGSIGPHLILKCEVHPHQETKVASDTDFKAVAEGGCSNLCEAELSCGHKCQSVCHVLNRSHENYKCYFPCKRTKENCQLGHICNKKCFEVCGRCEIYLEKQLPCKHVKTLPCHVDINKYKCLETVEVELKICGHINKKPCFLAETAVHCHFPCKERLPCGHSCKRSCHPGDDPDHLKYKCFKTCEKDNKSCTRKHRCHKKCYEDCGECKVKVTVNLDCGHTQKLYCSTDPSSVLCKQPCKRTLSCGHQCQLLCFEACKDCHVKVKKVIPDCGHSERMACFETPTKDMCRKFCERILSCKHQCQNLCCEPCHCEEIVLSHIKSACGHEVEIPCYLQGKDTLPHSETLLLSCKMPCGKTLECGHMCRGTCGNCLQGRIHMPCKEKCNRILICGHSCKFDCAKNCPPCSQKCEYSCRHSQCSAKCGFPCVPCVEPCTWRCEHFQCNRRCHQSCNRYPCYVACNKKLPCGHTCVGFCGEPCPPLCRVCNKEELTTIFLGYEDEKDAKFVYLEDCKHVIESKGLDEWLKLTDNEISLKSCPRCKTHIKTTLRFMNHLKTVYTDIINIKAKVFGNFKIIQEKRQRLLQTLNELFIPDILTRENLYIEGLVLSLKQELSLQKRGRRNLMSLVDVDSISIKVDILSNLIKIISLFENRLNEEFRLRLIKHFDLLLRFFIKRNVHISEQEVLDFNLEINRFMRMAQLYNIQSSPEFSMCGNDKTINDLIESSWQIVNSIERYTNIQDEKVSNNLECLHEKLKIVSEKFENLKKQVVKAIGFSPGHWFKCRNGHYFVIGECGGAMEVGKCPDCGALIGGERHQLLDHNQHAGDMDGSAVPAYPTLVRH